LKLILLLFEMQKYFDLLSPGRLSRRLSESLLAMNLAPHTYDFTPVKSKREEPLLSSIEEEEGATTTTSLDKAESAAGEEDAEESSSLRIDLFSFKGTLTFPKNLNTDPLFIANALNLVLMLLYTLIDFLRSFDAANPALISAALIILAVAYVYDAYLYLRSWGVELPSGFALSGEVLNILGSVMYAITSVLYLYEATNESDTDAVFGMEAICTIIFLVDAVIYFAVWYANPAEYTPGRGCDWRDLDLWGNLLNVVPAIIYVVANVNGLMLHFSSRSSLDDALPPSNLNQTRWVETSLTDPMVDPMVDPKVDPMVGLGEWKPSKSSTFLRDLVKVYIYGDVIWTIDAVILIAAWCRDYVTWTKDDEEEEEEGALVASNINDRKSVNG
jgi:hypothetical protein